MEYSATYNNQLIKSINRFWSNEVKMCPNNINILLLVHKRVQKLYDVQQALERGEIALAREFAQTLDNTTRKVIPHYIQECMEN
ncbi:MAG: hypothetical protein EBU33_05990 [Sphingobacteriia bacterium]|nr:hypothetical protein [Sphingobacteriia bacterium]